MKHYVHKVTSICIIYVKFCSHPLSNFRNFSIFTNCCHKSQCPTPTQLTCSHYLWCYCVCW